MLPLSNHPVQFLAEECEALAELLKLHHAYPLEYPLSGPAFEIIFARSVKGERETRKLLFDVLRGNIGWSLKTSQVVLNALNTGSSFEVVLQRCDILSNKSLSVQTPPSELGKHILAHFYRFYEDSIQKQKVEDPRTAFLLRAEVKDQLKAPAPAEQEHKFVLFQEQFRLYSEQDVVWEWANDGGKSLIGRVNGRSALRWYRSGTQLFGVYYVPEDVCRVSIPNRRVTLNQMLSYLAELGIIS